MYRIIDDFSSWEKVHKFLLYLSIFQNLEGFYHKRQNTISFKEKTVTYIRSNVCLSKMFVIQSFTWINSRFYSTSVVRLTSHSVKKLWRNVYWPKFNGM